MTQEPKEDAAPRWPFLLVLAAPVLAGLAYMANYGAPTHYLAINAAVLLMSFGLVLLPWQRLSETWIRIGAALLLALFVLPLITGPEIDGIARWIPIGPFVLHAGMATVPALMVIASQRENCSPIPLLVAAIIALLQPDAASGLALSFGCLAVATTTHRWEPGVIATIAFIATMIAATGGDLPPQDFVERVLVEAVSRNWMAGLGLIASAIGALILLLFLPRISAPTRAGLAGSFFGFMFISVTSNYPTPLIGYGVAPILGYGLALGLARNLKRRS